MSGSKNTAGAERVTIERTFDTTAEQMWRMWTTKQGIEAWWGPEGFRVDVLRLEPQPGGTLHYAMTATGAEQVAFMKQAGLPLTNEAHATFRSVAPPSHLSFDSVVDFVPGVAPYTIANDVEIVPRGDRVDVVLTVDALHDAEWTSRLVAGRESQFDKLADVVRRRG